MEYDEKVHDVLRETDIIVKQEFVYNIPMDAKKDTARNFRDFNSLIMEELKEIIQSSVYLIMDKH